MKDFVDAETYATANIVETKTKGAAFALNLKTRASATLREDKRIICRNNTAKEVAKATLNHLGYSQGVEVNINTEIPENRGFGEKESIATATALAIAGALAKEYGSINELKIDVYMRDQFLVIEDRLINKRDLMTISTQKKRFDRVYASLYGGFAIADNIKRKILRHGEMETLHAVILIPKKREKTSREEHEKIESQLEVIFNEALCGNLNTAMNMNSTILTKRNTLRLLAAGALAVSASDSGSLVGLTRDKEKTGKIAEEAKKIGNVITNKPMNEQARILIKPKKIYRINDFMELKKDQPYEWL